MGLFPLVKSNNSPYTSKRNDINALTAENRGYQGPQRTFTPLAMSLEEAFTKLHAKGALQPIDPTPSPPYEKRSESQCLLQVSSRERVYDITMLDFKHHLHDKIEDNRLLISPAAIVSNRGNPLGSA